MSEYEYCPLIGEVEFRGHSVEMDRIDFAETTISIGTSILGPIYKPDEKKVLTWAECKYRKRLNKVLDYCGGWVASADDRWIFSDSGFLLMVIPLKDYIKAEMRGLFK